MSYSASKPTFNLFSFTILLTGIVSGFTLAVYAYLGTFSRHMADDYCSAGLTGTNIFSWFWQNYQIGSNRYSNYMLMTLSESISPRSVAFLPVLMIVLWVVGIAWLLKEASRLAGQPWSRLLSWSMSLLVVFLALLQAPNRFQMLYWRSSMATHFAPLVFMPWLAAFLIRSLYSARKAPLAFWIYPLAFFLSFLLGGFSEPTMLMLNLLLGLSFLAAWVWIRPESRGAALTLLGFSLVGSVTALIVMITAPATALRLNDAPPSLLILVERSFRFTFDFIVDSFRTLPIPALFTLAIPLLIFFGLYASSAPLLTQSQRKRVLLVLALVPVLSYLLIVASFAPSVYAQSYPIERARFAGQLCLVVALMMEGAGLGILCAQWRPHRIVSLPLRTISAVLLMLLAFYPLRAGWLALADIPEYRARAQAWDERDAEIRSLRAKGETDLIVAQFDGIYGIKELDFSSAHWINRCAARYYQVNSITAISRGDHDPSP